MGKMRMAAGGHSRAGAASLVLVLSGLLAAGCGSSAAPQRTASIPAYVREPFTAQQRRIAAGARLIVSDGCSTCHLESSSSKLAPSFESFAGHEVTLADGRRVLVDEAFLRAGLVHPAAHSLRGYDPRPMLRALARLDLTRHPRQVAELAAFIEEVGPEP